VRTERAPTDSPEYSQALKMDVEHVKNAATQAHLLQFPDLAIELLHYTVAYRTLSTDYCSVPHDIRSTAASVDTSLKDYDASLMHGCMTRALSGLNLDWLELDGDKARIDSFISLSTKEKRSIMTYVSAVTLAEDPEQYIQSGTSMNLRDYWQPTEDNYFKRVSRDKLIEHATELNLDPGESVATKKSMVEFLSTLFSNSKQKIITAWIPPIFR